MKRILTFLLILFFTSNSQTISITNCTELQQLILNNSTVSYNITNEIDCAGNEFTTNGNLTSATTYFGLKFLGYNEKKKSFCIQIFFFFLGSLNGNGFKVKNFVINKPSNNFIGVFAYGEYCSVSNIHFKNITLLSNKFGGVLFGMLSFSTISNIILEEINSEVCDLGSWCVGGLLDSSATNITVVSSSLSAKSGCTADVGNYYIYKQISEKFI